MNNIQVTKRRKVGRPSLDGMQDPKMILRRMHAVWKFKKLRAEGIKFDSAVEETRAYMMEKFRLKKASTGMIKTILAETIPRDAEEEWSVEICFDSVTGQEYMALSFVPKKSYTRCNSLSLKLKNQ